MKKRLVNAILISIGLMLSPITWWNDPFINIPISYLAASALAYFFSRLFPISFIFFYWLTNILGIFLLYAGGIGLIREKSSRGKQVLAVIVYSIIILVLSICGIIRPVVVK